MAGNENGAQNKTTGNAKADIDRTADQGSRIADATREGVNKMSDMREQTMENTRRIVQTGLEAASRQAQEASEGLARTIGTGGEEGQRLAEQSKQDLEAVARCGTLLTQTFQDVSRSWFELSQKQLQHNLEGAKKLASAKSAQEFSAIQSELVRETLEQVLQSSRTIAEKSLNAADEAGKVFSSVARSASQAR